MPRSVPNPVIHSTIRRSTRPRALAQWEQEREALRAWYDREFYRETPKRPRNWIEERMEEIEREGE